MNKNLFLVFHLVPDNVSLPYERFCRVNFSVSMHNSQTKIEHCESLDDPVQKRFEIETPFCAEMLTFL